MQHSEIERYKNRMHHYAVFHLADGSTVEGNMQPWDDEYVYLTLNEGASGGRVKISDIRRIEFPNE